MIVSTRTTQEPAGRPATASFGTIRGAGVYGVTTPLFSLTRRGMVLSRPGRGQ